MNTMTSFTVLGMLKTVIVVAVLGRGTHSHSNYGPSASFNDFISNNAIINSINNTAATGSGMVASTGNGHSSAVDLTSRNEAARLYRMRQRSVAAIVIIVGCSFLFSFSLRSEADERKGRLVLV